MDISINLSDIQVGKNYVLEFCLSEDGKRVVKSTKVNNKSDKTETDDKPSIDDFKPKPPTIDDVPKISKNTEFKIESSFDDKLDEGQAI